eukprot:1158924-Pelagomonas_calceolata.AAC.5
MHPPGGDEARVCSKRRGADTKGPCLWLCCQHKAFWINIKQKASCQAGRARQVLVPIMSPSSSGRLSKAGPCPHHVTLIIRQVLISLIPCLTSRAGQVMSDKPSCQADREQSRRWGSPHTLAVAWERKGGRRINGTSGSKLAITGYCMCDAWEALQEHMASQNAKMRPLFPPGHVRLCSARTCLLQMIRNSSRSGQLPNFAGYALSQLFPSNPTMHYS